MARPAGAVAEHGSRQGYPPALRLKKRSEFLEVQKNGRRLQTEQFLVLALPRPGHPTRIGITVSRKVAGAVGRNRIKRLFREAFRRGLDRWPRGWEIVIVARRESVGASYAQIEEALGRVLARLPEHRGAPS
jgi:ribonuclease P protein component